MLRTFFKINSSKFLVGSIIIFLLSFFIVEYPISDLYNQVFLPQPERVTELYFFTPESLPRVVTAKTQARFTFHVTNHEAQPTTYSYIVRLETPGNPSQIVTTGNFTLTDSASTDIPVGFTVSKPKVRSLVTVQLIGRTENIHFWVSS